MITALIFSTLMAGDPIDWQFGSWPQPVQWVFYGTTKRCSRCEVCDCGSGDSCPCYNYDRAIYDEAVKSDKLLVVWVGQKAQHVPGALVCRASTFGSQKSKGVVVCRPVNGELIIEKKQDGTPGVDGLLFFPVTQQPSRFVPRLLPSFSGGGC